MRLTLRTLLAYLDDILEPAQAREIGEKIHESSLASALVGRIRDVMRRRRLTAPAVDGEGDVDANLVAEYLDNTLPPEGVADIEKICLESDIHLAEVGACHQILTLVLGEPVEIVPNSRERMYALNPATAAAAGEPVEAAAPAAVESAEAPAPAPVRETAPASFESAIPDYLKPRPFWKRMLPYAAVALLLAVWIGLLIQDRNLLGGLFPSSEPGPARVAQRPSATAPADFVLPDDRRSEVPPPPGEPAEGPPDLFAPIEPQMAAAPAPRKPFNVDPAPPADAPEVPDEPELVVAAPARSPQLPPLGDEPAPASREMAKIDAPENLQPMRARPAEPVEPAAAAPAADNPPENPAALPMPPAVKAAPVEYISNDGVLLRFDLEDEAWFVMPRRAVIHPLEVIAVPEPFEAAIRFGEQRNQLTLLDGTVARVLGPTAAAPFGLGIQRGRVVLRGPAAEQPGAEGTLTVAIGVGEELWRVELLTPDTVCGLQITPKQPNQVDQTFGENWYTGEIFVRSGTVRFADGTNQVRVIHGPGRMSLNPEDRGTPTELASVPVWLEDRRPLSTSPYSRLFQKEFEFDERVSLSLTNAVQDRRPEMARLAVRCLGLVGDYRGLVEALRRNEHEEARQEAISSLRTWLILSPDHPLQLRDTLSQQFHPEQAEAIERLLWGFSDEEARTPAASQQLIDWLGNDSLAVRELAYYHLLRLTGRRMDRFDYRPNNSPQQRKASINQWQRHLDKEGSILPPVPMSSDAGGASRIR